MRENVEGFTRLVIELEAGGSASEVVGITIPTDVLPASIKRLTEISSAQGVELRDLSTPRESAGPLGTVTYFGPKEIRLVGTNTNLAAVLLEFITLAAAQPGIV